MSLSLSGSSLLSYGSGCGYIKVKGDDIPQTDYAHKSVEPVRPKVSWTVCRKPTKTPTCLGADLHCCCPIAWAVLHRNGGSPFVSISFPYGSFSPIVSPFHFPDNSFYFVFCTNFWRPLSFPKDSLSPYSGKLVGVSTKRQCYLAIRIMVEKVLVGSHIRHLEDDFVELRNLKVGIPGLGYKGTSCLTYPCAGLRASFQNPA